jgi:hypothetical protein
MEADSIFLAKISYFQVSNAHEGSTEKECNIHVAIRHLDTNQL